jgi:protein-disulfide isomerase
MPFHRKKVPLKSSVLKPTILTIAILLAVSGAYTFGKMNSTSDEKDSASAEPKELEVKSSDVGDVEEVIAKWIAANPKAIIESVNNMQKEEMEKRTKDAQKNISAKKSELFNDKNSPQFAPSGYDVTIVEFFDYSCGYCKKAQATIEQLLNSDKKVRLIFREFPIFGQTSIEASSVALAVHLVEPGSYKKFHDAMMKSNEKGKEGALKVVKSVGINVSKVEEALVKQKDKIASIIQENQKLGSEIGVNGTPGFVIGEELIPGAVELSDFKQKIAAIRKK